MRGINSLSYFCNTFLFCFFLNWFMVFLPWRHFKFYFVRFIHFFMYSGFISLLKEVLPIRLCKQTNKNEMKWNCFEFSSSTFMCWVFTFKYFIHLELIVVKKWGRDSYFLWIALPVIPNHWLNNIYFPHCDEKLSLYKPNFLVFLLVFLFTSIHLATNCWASTRLF